MILKKAFTLIVKVFSIYTFCFLLKYIRNREVLWQDDVFLNLITKLKKK